MGRRKELPKPPRLRPYDGRARNLEDYYECFDEREGYCWCGCGLTTEQAKDTETKTGHLKGEYRSFVRGHQGRCLKYSLTPTHAQTELAGNLPEERPPHVTSDEWEIICLHVNEMRPWSWIARHLGITQRQAKYRGQVAQIAIVAGERRSPNRQQITHYEPGDPVFGERGVLDDDGETVGCHICGKRFAFLGLHAILSHEMNADEYRREFGLKQSTSLISEDLKNKKRDTSHLDPYREQNTEWLKSVPFEVRSEWCTGREVREEQRRDPAHQEHVAKFVQAGVEAIASLRAEGRYVEPGWPEEANRRAQEVLSELRQDPEWHAKWTSNLSQARGGISTEQRVCPICETEFEEKTYGKRKYCSEDCYIESLRQRATESPIAASPEARAKLSRYAKERNPHRERDHKGRYA